MKNLEYWKFKYKNDSWIQIYERDLKTGKAKTENDFTQAAEKALSFYKEKDLWILQGLKAIYRRNTV